jgi:hypothetical protein
MNNAALLRTLIIYAICIPVAIFVGYRLTNPLTYSTFAVVGMFLLLLLFPVLVRWHHLLLIASWNVVAVMFFIPGQPAVSLVMVAMSLGIALLQKAMDRDVRFLSAPSLTASLIVLAVVVLFTAKLTGGIGIKTLGSNVYGGKRYVLIIGAILGYFAMTAFRIPRKKAGLYVALFFLGGLTGLVGDLVYVVGGSSLSFIFWMFPPNIVALQAGYLEIGASRLSSAGPLASAVCFYMLAKFGFRGLFDVSKPWRMGLFLASLVFGMLGGYRGLLILFGLSFIPQFFFEGLHRTRLLPLVLIGGLLAAALTIPFASKMPFMVQRTLSIVPFIKLDPMVTMDAEATVDWRFKMWTAVTRMVPEYLWLGKGFGFTAADFARINRMSESSDAAENWDSTAVGNYHNGPLSVIITFGIWGAIAFAWFLTASVRALYANFRWGDSELHRINTLLFSVYIGKTVVFLIVGGGIESDMAQFAGWLGLSIALNGGIASRPAEIPAPEPEQPQPLLMSPRPMFHRSRSFLNG